MAKTKNPLFGFDARGTLANLLTFRHRDKQTIAEKKPIPKDAKTSGQLAWRTMYQLCADLWHTLTDAEKATWETLARRQHMTGYAYYLSQCLRPNPGIYLPLAGGTMSGDINMATKRITNLPAPVADEEPARKTDMATSIEAHRTAATHTQPQPPATHTHTIIQDADGDTKIQVEKSADEDKIHMDVKGVEAFLLNDAGVLTLAKQSAARAYKHASDQSIANITVTKVVLEAENYDIQNEFDPATNYRFTAKTAGLYLILAQLDYEPVAPGALYQCRIHKNNVYYQTGNCYAVGTVVGTPMTAAIVQLAVNDYIEIYTYQTSGAAATLVKLWDGCWLAVTKVT